MAQPVKQLKPKSAAKAPARAMPAKMAAKSLQPVSAPKGKATPRNPIAAARNKGQQGDLMKAADKRRSMSKGATTVGVDKYGQVATTNMREGNKRRQGSAAAKGKQGGINIPKFAGEVSANYAKGVKALGQSLDGLPGIGRSRKASGVVGKTMKAAPGNRAALKKVLGK